MLRMIALGALLGALPAAAQANASTFSYVAIDHIGPSAYDANLTRLAVEDDGQMFAHAINDGGASVYAIYSGTGDHDAYASTRYQYDFAYARRVDFTASGHVTRMGTSHAYAIVAGWQTNALGDLLWEDIWQIDVCSSCDVFGFAAFSRQLTRVGAAGDSLFLTITANAFYEGGPVPSITQYLSRAGTAAAVPFTGQAVASVFRDVTISAVPEPATWALLIMGFGGVGAAARRGRADVAHVVA